MKKKHTQTDISINVKSDKGRNTKELKKIGDQLKAQTIKMLTDESKPGGLLHSSFCSKPLNNPKNDKRISIKIDSSRSGDVHIKLNTGENLGLIQSIDINGSVGNFNKVTLTSILEKAEVDMLQQNTELIVILPFAYTLRYWISKLFS